MDGRSQLGGRRRLRVIGREPLTYALDIAVSRALRRGLPEYDRERVEAIQDDVRRTFGELLRANGARVRGVSKARFLLELERSRDSVLVARRRAETELERLQRRVERLRSIQADAREHEGASGLLRSRGVGEELARYQRRIEKLTGSLTRTEEALHKLERLENGSEGIASIYRTVQGLSGDEFDLEHKRSLLAEIFAANLRLQQKTTYSPPR